MRNVISDDEVEQNALELLEKQGCWTIIYGPEIAQDGSKPCMAVK